MADDAQEKPRRRWFRIAPGRLLVVLLAVEGLLWLAERFQWFAFNRHKGWTVLITVASVVVFFLIMLLWWFAALIFRWRFQYSLLSLLVMPLVVVIAFGWLAVEMKAAERQKQILAWIKKTGGGAAYDYEYGPTSKRGATPPSPAWLRKLLGEDVFEDVVFVTLIRADVGDAGLERLTGLTQLQWLYLSETNVGDAGLEHLKGLSRLQRLDLDDTKVTDAGLEYLKGLAHLQTLSVFGTNISDTGLEHLTGLRRIQRLDLNGTNVTDTGLEHLRTLTNLEVLILQRTKVSDAGVKKLQQALPNCQILH